MRWEIVCDFTVTAVRITRPSRKKGSTRTVERWSGPEAQPRVKVARRGKFSGVYTPPTADLWKKQIVDAWDKAATVGETPITGPVKLVVTCYFAHPREHYKRHGKSPNLRDDAPEWKEIAPDFDNLGKAVADTLTVKKVDGKIVPETASYPWKNDGQIVDGRVIKEYGPVPKARIVIYRWGQGDGGNKGTRKGKGRK